jgi:acyl carrier protein
MKGMSLKECLEWDIKDQISRFLRIDRSRVDSEGNLADYGFDSISLSEFATTLTDHFEIEITPSVFFGHSTTKKLAKYYLKKHHDAIAEFYREDTQNTGDIYNEDEAGKAFTLKEIAASRESNDICRGLNDKDGLDGIDRAYDMHEIQREHITGLKDGAGIKSEKSEGIAIIGMSGRFPEHVTLMKCGIYYLREKM